MEVIPKLNRHSMPKALEVKPSGPPPKDPYTNCFYHLLWLYFVTVSEFSSLAKS